VQAHLAEHRKEAHVTTSGTPNLELADAEVSERQIKTFCAMLEDPNPSYWDAEFARTHWGGLISPPALLSAWTLPLPWRPDGSGWDATPPLQLRVDVPGDTAVNVVVESLYHRPVQVGDLIALEHRLDSVSEERHTRLGPGRFVTTVATFRNQHGEVAGIDRSTVLRFASTHAAVTEEPAARPADSVDDLGPPLENDGGQRYFDDISPGETIAPIIMPVTYRKVVMVMGATGDYFGGHHDPLYARAQGQPDIYVNTIFLQGFADRLLTTWGGPRSFVGGRTLRMRRSVFPGDTIYACGTVKSLGVTGKRNGLVEVEVQMGTQHGQCADVSASLRLPRAGGGI
jgi:acyl dehydratase